MTPTICGRGLRRAVLSVLTGLGTVAALPAGAVTYLIDFTDDAGLVFGSFEAPKVGGAVTSLTGTLSGVTFDSMLPGTTSFAYDPSINEFTYAGSFPSFTNSANNPLCAVGGCFLEFYPNPDPLTPGDYLAVDALLNNIDAGTKYRIVPPKPSVIPLPATLALLAGGLGVIGLVAGRRARPA